MDLSLKNNITYAFIKKPVRISVFLVFFMIPFIKLFELDRFFVNTVLGRQIGNYYVVSDMFHHHTLLSIAILFAFLAILVFRALAKFVSSLTNPSFKHADVFGAKYVDMPPIPQKEAVFEFMRQADRAYDNGLDGLDVRDLSAFGVDKYGNLK